MKKYLIYILLASALLGLYFSIILTIHHVDSSYQSFIVDSLCGNNSQSGCNVVNRSDISEFMGLPLALWGFFFYATVLFTAIFYMVTGAISFLQIIVPFAVFAGVADIGLLLYSVAALDTICIMCSITYVSTAGILFALISMLVKGEGFMPDISKIKSLQTTIKLPLILAILLIPVTGGFVYNFADTNSAKNNNGGSDQKYLYYLEKSIQAFVNDYDNGEINSFDVRAESRKGATRPILDIVEFADFLCPYCKITGASLKEFVNKYPDEVSVTYRNYPLDQKCNPQMQRQLHDGSCALSYAAYCAGEQNRFWDIHDLFYQNQANFGHSVKESDIYALVSKTSVNMAAFKQCMSSDKAKNSIKEDIDVAGRLNLTGTPSIYINGRKVEGGFIEFLAERLLMREKQKLMQPGH